MNTERTIPFFDYPALFKKQEAEILNVLKDVLSRGAYILQKDLEEFEVNLAKYLDVKYAIGVANGTDALMLALRAAGIQPDDEIILPSHTYVATAASVHFLGAVPVLVECGAGHMIDPKSVQAAITKKTRGIMPVQLNGRTCNMDVLQEIADEYSLLIIEDAAQGLGSKFKGRCAGTFGAVGTISFYPAKVLGCFGDAGAVVTNDDEIAEKIYLLRDHGRNEKGEVVAWGFNSRLDNIQAAVLNFKLKTYPKEVERRRLVAAMYEEGLSDLPQLHLPPPPDADPDHFDVYQNYEIEAENRDELRLFLEENGIKTLIQWGGKAVHQHRDLGFNVSLPRTDELFKCCLMLPMNTSIRDDDVRYVMDTIRRFYQK
jgi:dTDP-4-amino-4,6-dideoxygalactose transaminase